MARLIPLVPLGFLLLEIAGFVIVGRWLGLFPTLALVVLGTLGGLTILRRQGVLMLRRMQASLAAGEPPVAEMFHAACLALAGILLIIPGFFSDLLAAFLLLPPLRRLLYRWTNGRIERDGSLHFGRGARGRNPVIEGDYVDLDRHDPSDTPPEPGRRGDRPWTRLPPD